MKKARLIVVLKKPREWAPAVVRVRQRVMVKKNRVSAGTSVLATAVAIAAIVLGLGGCAAATAKPADPARAAKSVDAAQSVDKARLTGYASSPLDAGPSGPVSVVLQGASAARLDQLINGLQKSTGVSCVENAQLYQIDFTHVAGGKRAFDVAGYQCANLVNITSDGKTVTRVDGKCALLTAVRRLLPATATATAQLTPPDCVK
jgi:hypothetical protein